MKQIRTLGVALIAACGVAACAGAGSPARPSPAGGVATGAGTEANGGQRDLAAVRAATAAFHNIDKAIDAGYVSPVGGVCDELPGVGAMGVHSANQALIMNPALDPESPEVLLYAPTGDGNYRMIGVEYLQPILLRDTNNPSAPPTPWFGATMWPSNFVEIAPAPSLFGQAFDGPMAGHVPGMPWHYDLHVWIWAPNPSGMFAPWNPSISCH